METIQVNKEGNNHLLRFNNQKIKKMEWKKNKTGVRNPSMEIAPNTLLFDQYEMSTTKERSTKIKLMVTNNLFTVTPKLNVNPLFQP